MQGFVLHSLPLRLNWGHSNKEKIAKEQETPESRVPQKSGGRHRPGIPQGESGGSAPGLTIQRRRWHENCKNFAAQLL